jgi:2-amino-4-hydroxy-6-hydroxymethyldihydropteridine diphosphokinase
MFNRYLIGLGSSHPCGLMYLEQAVERLLAVDGLCILSRSEIERGGGVGTDDPLTFYNTVLFVTSSLNLTALWFELASIETKLGRIRTKINGPRTIDLDLLYWSGLKRSDAFITLPHPRFFQRKFACDLAMQALRNAGEDVLAIKIGSLVSSQSPMPA